MTRSLFSLSPQASADIDGIWDYIASENPNAADRVRERIYDSLLSLGRRPYIGHTRSEVTTRPLLFFPALSYLIIYDPAPHPIAILRVLHGARDVASLL